MGDVTHRMTCAQDHNHQKQDEVKNSLEDIVTTQMKLITETIQEIKQQNKDIQESNSKELEKVQESMLRKNREV